MSSLVSRPCKVCGKERPSRRGKYCCDECMAVGYRAASRKAEQRYRDKKCTFQRRRLSVWRDCAWCGGTFSAKDKTPTLRRYCSAWCYRQAKLGRYSMRLSGKSTPAALLRAVVPSSAVTLEYVINRDGGRCRGCGTQVKRTANNSDPRQAHRDHIVPMSLGGTDTPDNVQLLCRACNTTKGAGSIGSQMLLFG